jgi:hypothetical protein
MMEISAVAVQGEGFSASEDPAPSRCRSEVAVASVCFSNPSYSWRRRCTRSSKEECVSLRIPSRLGQLLLKILARLKFLPLAGRENVLVSLVPSSINHFGQVRICVSAFQIFDVSRRSHLLVYRARRGRRSGVRVVKEKVFGLR